MGEPDAPTSRPVKHGRGQRIGLGDKSQFSGLHIERSKTGIQAQMWRQQANAIGPQYSQQAALCRLQHGVFLRLIHARRHNHRGVRTQPGELLDQRRHSRWRSANDR